MGGLDRGMVYVAGLLAMFGLAGCSGLPALGTTASTTEVGGATSASGFLSPSSSVSAATDEPLPVIEHPAKADLTLAGPLGDRSLGKADAPLTIYEYASLTCPYCKAFHLGVFDQEDFLKHRFLSKSEQPTLVQMPRPCVVEFHAGR